MKPEEAIKWLKAWSATHQNEDDNIREAVWSAIGFMRVLERYKALGTVEELKNALEKQVAKKPKGNDYYIYDWDCPTCGKYHSTSGSYCSNCGQKLDWSDI